MFIPGDLQTNFSSGDQEENEVSTKARSVKKCPRCPKVMMLSFLDRSTKLEIDSCPECYGLWFDREELKLLFESPDLSTRILEEGADSALVRQSRDTQLPDSAAPSSVPFCPVCRDPLFLSTLGSTQVDYCLACRGIWLDHAELEALAKAFQAGEKGNLLIMNQLVEGLGTPSRPNPKAREFLEALERYRRSLFCEEF